MSTQPHKYQQAYRPQHPRAQGKGVVYRHVIVAEAALGKHLPDGVEVHHVDENKQNNANSNLVICQDSAYHSLLHVRARAVRAGGNPNTQKLCGRCGELKPFSEFNRMSVHKGHGLQSRCRPCASAGFREWASKRRGAA